MKKKLEVQIFFREWVAVALVAGLIVSLGVISFATDIKVQKDCEACLSGLGEDGLIAIKIDGAIEKPGLYHFHPGVKLKEILKAAGLKKEADRSVLDPKVAIFEPCSLIIPFVDKKIIE